MKQYKELSRFSFCLFVFIFFFILVGAMNESALKRLRQKAREKEVERKGETLRREQIEKEKTEEVQLTGAIYVEPLASRTPTTEEIKIFE